MNGEFVNDILANRHWAAKMHCGSECYKQPPETV